MKRMGKRRPLSKKQVQNSVPEQSGAYNILNRSGEVVYSGMAGARRLQDRLQEHVDAGDVPGAASFQFRTTGGTAEAARIEAELIKRHQPKHNQQGK